MGVAILFPGQGTQFVGMGSPWSSTPFWAVVERAQAALGEPLAPLLLDAPAEALARTREAQLSVFLCSLMAWEAVSGRIEPPVAFAGHSLGQLTALVAAQVLTLEEGIRLVARRASATQASADRRPGRMAALIGADVELAEAACGAEGVDGAWLANDNAPGQVVIGGTPAGVEAAGAAAAALGARRVIPLKVGGAFHTPLFEDARIELEPVLAATAFATPTAPVVSNVDARAHAVPAGWGPQLGAHLVSPVRWRESMLTLASLGADSLVEVGPGSVLAGLARRTLPGVPVRNVAVPADVATVLTPMEVS